MLWSLIKIVVFVAVAGALAWCANYLLGSSDGMAVTVGGTEYPLNAFQSVIAIIALMFVVWLLLKIFHMLVAVFRFMRGDETALSRHFDRNREKKGLDAVSDGLMALASGEGETALLKAQKAGKYLDKPALTNLLTAQAAEMAGDTKKAEETYRLLIEDDKTRFVGVRGIMKQKLVEGDTETALALAEKAFALKPKHDDVGNTLLQLQADKEDWTGARKTLSAKLKHGQLPRDVHRRRDAVLALSEAKEIIADGNSIEARESAIEANRLSPDLIPAAVMAAQSYVAQSKPRYATRVLKKAWDAQPHPDLAAAFAAIVPEETPVARIKRFRALVKSQPDHAETKMLMTELHIANEDFPEARRQLGDLVETDPTARSVTLMAAIERGEGASDTIVKGWLARALSVSRGPSWVCDSCQNIHAEWEPICGNCKSFDTLTWKTPPTAEVAMPGGVQMLPLIVGALEDKSTSEEPVTAEADVVIESASDAIDAKVADAVVVEEAVKDTAKT